jgi:hypothetical protein
VHAVLEHLAAVGSIRALIAVFSSNQAARISGRSANARSMLVVMRRS